ncbi:sugar transferase [Vagococcus carniphilus]|uniref:sugar transferase n=1 Tax=Vagococcus carniphilus TaxID=218144 RepID=UPI0028901E33|nr:sugar transferase [Vagococcus carniphilus]MDT2813655.1 sugar transferase [Vagococcus carniphilus]
MYKYFFKRLIDVVVSLVALVVLLPVFIIICILVRTKLGSPIIFTQKRPGKDGKVFKMYKFRTMTDQVDSTGALLPDQVRLTRFGSVLRSTSLDELPELLNILKGEMSLIGPRPLLEEYLLIYNKEQKRRHDVRPGLTGWAQINGRNTLTWTEKFELDLEYVDAVSFCFDVKIFFLTIKKVIIKEGISAEGSATIEKFNGDN